MFAVGLVVILAVAIGGVVWILAIMQLALDWLIQKQNDSTHRQMQLRETQQNSVRQNQAWESETRQRQSTHHDQVAQEAEHVRKEKHKKEIVKKAKEYGVHVWGAGKQLSNARSR